MSREIRNGSAARLTAVSAILLIVVLVVVWTKWAEIQTYFAVQSVKQMSEMANIPSASPSPASAPVATAEPMQVAPIPAAPKVEVASAQTPKPKAKAPAKTATGKAAPHARELAPVSVRPAVVVDVASQACRYADNIVWAHWFAAPYGPTAEGALTDAKLDWYLRCSQAIPEYLKPAVKAAIRAKPQGENVAYITPDMILPEMTSGPSKTHPYPHIMRNVPVARIQVAFGIVRAAETPTWSVKAADGSILVLGDPYGCGNLSVIRIIPPPVIVTKEQCRTIEIHPDVGDHILVPIFARRDLPPTSCIKVTMNDKEYMPIRCSSCDWSGFFSVDAIPTGYQELFSFSFIATATTVVISLPMAASEAYIGLCDTRAGKQSQGALVEPAVWGKNAAVKVSRGSFPLFDAPRMVGKRVLDGKEIP